MHKRTADGRFLENVNWLEASLLLFSSLSSCTAQVHIAAKIGDKVILPCTFTCSIKDLSDLTIVWESSSKPVHTYHENEDHTEHQSAEFKGRTCLFYNELEHGNASLLLKNVTEADNRVYTCTVDFMKEVKHQNVLVTVVFFVYATLFLTSSGPLRSGFNDLECSKLQRNKISV
ncbi:HERV-H LTR-associating protein 2 isoform X3 [Latimeria chalumnae]|uniref:HERV-H LTR-associating protein 2 isoform X3 n=1 Tax=Latimeria chalumnae TaxID=7897 RepID=UPI00313CEA27